MHIRLGCTLTCGEVVRTRIPLWVSRQNTPQITPLNPTPLLSNNAGDFQMAAEVVWGYYRGLTVLICRGFGHDYIACIVYGYTGHIVILENEIEKHMLNEMKAGVM